MAARTRKVTPAKAAAPQAEPVADPYADLDEPDVYTAPASAVDVDKIPESLKSRVEDAWNADDDKWRLQLTPSPEATKAIISAMRKYAENRPDGRVTLRTKNVDGGFRYKVSVFTPRK